MRVASIQWREWELEKWGNGDSTLKAGDSEMQKRRSTVRLETMDYGAI